MKTCLICALACIALANGLGEVHDASPYTHLLRVRRAAGEQVCEPGSTKKQDCNNCFCVKDGSAWACTLRGCLYGQIPSGDNREIPTVKFSEGIPSPRVQREEIPTQSNAETRPQVCLPGSTKMEDCNSCFCIGDGSGWGCTEMACYQPSISISESPEGVNTQSDKADNPSLRVKREEITTQSNAETRPQVCLPGSTKMEDCNNCFCIRDGSGWACTEMACYQPSISISESSEGVDTQSGKADNPSLRVKREEISTESNGAARPQVCVPGSTKTLDCNSCFCAEDGSGWGCTLKGCFQFPISIPEITEGPDTQLNREKPQVCVPGSTKMEDCNTCFCIGDGSGWGCTEIGCIQDSLIITENPEGANTPSDKEETDPKLNAGTGPQECLPGSTKTVACNSCHCAQGRWTCTKIGCIVHTDQFHASDNSMQ